METEVLVVGAGPTGLLLAAELQLGGADVTVIDRLPEPSRLSRAAAVQSRTLEFLDQRGLLEPLLATGDYPVSRGHFAGLPLDPDRLPPHLPSRSLPQAALEAFLTDRLTAQGVPVLHGHELVALSPDADAVTSTVRHADGEQAFRSAYLVAADGAHSTVRSLLGLAFPGRPGTVTAIAADVRLADPHPPRTHTRTADGTWAAQFALDGDLRRLALGGPKHALPRDVPVTEEEVRAGLAAVYGPEVELLELGYAYRITNAARLVEQYRHGRVLLAGDAAHIHLPIGAQGMNTGLQDAANLGWKLAATLRGRAPAGLLDTYHAERHPVAAQLLRTVQAQGVLWDWQGSDDPDLAALRQLFATLMQLPDTMRYLAGLMTGLDLSYPMPDAPDHPLLGRAAPDLPLTTPAGPRRLRELLRTGRGLLVDPTGTLAGPAAPWTDRVDRATTPDPAIPALLVRPDGYVCWAAAPGAGEPETLVAALERWFGGKPVIDPGTAG
ncbi:FAD-dependent monooxygenase [Kitasatospora sp. LaBMicrA B282]|uniref:FAD-dependent monooxygenase n=1 Tax=Kitasatospora sp. LaBMicrA B282 TaxID=3420949 RepID=UPI003D0BAC89